MRRYLLFTFYASRERRQGWDAFDGSFNTYAEAEEAAKRLKADGWQIVDTTTGDVY